MSNSHPVAAHFDIHKPSKASWTALDALPDSIRRLLWEAPTSIDPVSAKKFTDELGERDALRNIIRCINAECAAFAAQYERERGSVLPSWAAGVTRQGY